MSETYRETSHEYNQTFEFTYENRDYYWQGDYTIESWGQTSDYDNAGMYEQEITIDTTESLTYYDDDTDTHIEVLPTPSLIVAIENQIERSL